MVDSPYYELGREIQIPGAKKGRGEKAMPNFALFDKNGRFCWVIRNQNGGYRFHSWCTAEDVAKFGPLVHLLEESEWQRNGHYVIYGPLVDTLDTQRFAANRTPTTVALAAD